MTTAPEPGDFDHARRLIEDIGIGMVTTLHPDGGLHTRPLQTLLVEGTEALWFFTDWSSPKVDELSRDRRAGVAYADSAKGRFVAVSGTCSLRRDTQMARKLWTVAQRAFYPDGPEDERLALLRIQIERLEYWIAPGPVSYLISAAQAAATGTPAAIIGENCKIK